MILARLWLRDVLRRPLQSLLCVLGIALGVAVVVAVDLANDSAHRAFMHASETVSGQTTHSVRGGPDGVADTLWARIRLQAGLREAAPLLTGHVAVVGADGHPHGVFELLGVEPLVDGLFRDWVGAAAQADDSIAEALIAEPGTAAMAAETAARLGLGQGDQFTIRAGGTDHTARLAAVIEPVDALQRSALARVLVVDIATAQEWLGQIGRVTQIDLIVPEGDQGRTVIDRVNALLADGGHTDVELVATGVRAGAQQEMVRAFRTNLTALSLLALLVGMFLVHATMTVAVVQRREGLGTLRCIGVSRAQILIGVLSQAGVLAVAGTLGGLALGIALAHGLLGLVTRTITDLYFVVHVRELALAPIILIKGLAVGLGATLVAALAPALEATWTAPRATRQRSTLEAATATLASHSAIIALPILVLSVVVLALSGRSLIAAFIGLFLMIVGYALLIPLVTGTLARLAAPVLGTVAGLPGRMAAGNVYSSLSRTGVATAALAVAVSATIGVGIMIGSFRLSVSDWLDEYLRADIYINVPDSRTGESISDDTLAAARTLAGVRAVGVGRWLTQDTVDGPLQIFAFETDRAGFDGFRFLHGDSDAIWPRYLAGEAVIVSEPFAWHRALRVGDAVRVLTAEGPREFPVAGIFRDYGSDRGTLVIHRPVFARLWDDPTITSLGLYLDDETHAETLAAQLDTLLPQARQLRINTVGSLRNASLEVFDRTFIITAVLRWLAMLVAGVGILSAVLTLLWERTRTLGVLRAMGFSSSGLRALLGIESSLLGLFAGLIAVPLGVVMAWVLVHVINRRAFGWSMSFTVEWSILVQAVLLAVITAFVASLYPAWRSARAPLPAALREE